MTAPSTPTGLTAVPGNRKVTLTWNQNPESDLATYIIHWGTQPTALNDWISLFHAVSTFEVTNLTNGTPYFFTIAAKNNAGLESAQSAQVTATPFADTTPPAISSTTPASGASGVDIATTLVISFSEAMAPASVTVSLAPTISLGTPTWDAQHFQLTLALAALEYTTTYTVSVEGTDLAGNALAPPKTFSFTTRAAPDTTPPSIASSTPAAGATDVAATARVSVTFTEPMNPTTVAVTVDHGYALGAPTWSLNDTTVTFASPPADFSRSTTYLVSVDGQDRAGNALAEPKTFSFSTSVPDTTPPTVLSTSPANNAAGVFRNQDIVVTFSEAMNRAATEGAFAVTSPAGITGAFAWNAAGTQLTFNPASALAFSQVVTFTIGTDARDLAGNQLAAAYTSRFTVLTGPQQANLISYPPLDGDVTSDGAVTTSGTTLEVGDLAYGSPRATKRGFLTFSLNAVPASATITSAYLALWQPSYAGMPFFIANVYAEHVFFGAALDASAFNTPVIDNLRWLQSNTTGAGYKTFEATAKVRDDHANRAARSSFCQVRLRLYPAETNSDAVADLVRFNTGEASTAKATMTVNYE